MPITAFEHRQTAHCESGTVSALLRHSGIDLSESMVFGISGALTFAYIPLIKVNGMPMIAYRMPPGRIIKGLSSRLGIKMQFHRFRDREQGMKALNHHLDQGRPVGMQASVFWLPYFPDDLRFHFNAHNLVAYGYEGDEYLLSDPTFEAPVRADFGALQKARFVKGALAPKGVIYYPQHIPAELNLATAIRKSVKATCRMMLRTPLPIIGVRGIRYMAAKIRAGSSDGRESKLLIGHMVRMQEEIGTGGAGFRFLYASFLQEAALLLDNSGFQDASLKLTDTGDEWRVFAHHCAQMVKGRMPLDVDVIADKLDVIAEREAGVYRLLEQSG